MHCQDMHGGAVPDQKLGLGCFVHATGPPHPPTVLPIFLPAFSRYSTLFRRGFCRKSERFCHLFRDTFHLSHFSLARNRKQRLRNGHEQRRLRTKRRSTHRRRCLNAGNECREGGQRPLKIIFGHIVVAPATNKNGLKRLRRSGRSANRGRSYDKAKVRPR